MVITKEQAIDILDKFEFLQGQRAGRELWNDKPTEVQEEDLTAYRRDVALLKEYVDVAIPGLKPSGLTFRYNEETSEWDRYEVYMTVDCATKEDFEYLKEAVEKQIAKKPCDISDGFEMSHLACPNCKNSVINYYNRKIKPPHCMMCGQKLDWEDK